MDSRVFLSLSLCFLSLFPGTAALHFPGRLEDKKTHGSILKLKTDGVSSAPFDPTRVTQISWRPRAKDKLEKSMVADNESGKSVQSEVRTSSGMFLNKAQDKVVVGIEARIAAWTFLPEENGESIQILHYELGQKYEPHSDYFLDKVNQELGGHRVATVLMYLSDVKKGGETVFPHSEAKDTQLKDDDWSDCAKNGYAVKAKKGDALLFYSLHPNATTDPLSLHGSCPVIEGEKWSATKWIHVRSFEKILKHANGGCIDENENCARWAASGECKRNPLYMVGSEGVVGNCMKSCKVPPCCDKSNVKRGLWTAEEDAKILAYVANHGIGNWTLVPHKAGLNRCGKSCRLRWTNYLRPDLKHDNFTPEEEQLILDYHKVIGSRWSLIAQQLPGRTDNDVKNYWNTKLKKKLFKMGIDPLTHKPFSQILSDYEKIASLPVLNISTNNMSSLVPIELSCITTINQPLPQQFISQETVQQHEVPSLTSSSSSSYSVPQLSSPRSFSCLSSPVPVAPSSPSSWCSEFLLGDPILSSDMDPKQEHNLQVPLITLQSSKPHYQFSEVAQERGCEAMYIGGQTERYCSEAASTSSANSFVEAILDRDNEIQSEFPEVLNEYFSF
ncbi:unnamed protein product [Camellia sinensis]